MPQIGWFEILIIVVLSILIIGPKDFPVVLKKIGSWVSSLKNYFSEIQKDITNESTTNINELNFEEEVGNIDELYHQAVSIIIQNQRASTSFLQRHLQIGYNRAARIIEQMEKEGIITEANHAGKRSVLKKND